ncbi:hypothetical protein [Carboxylicivirga marina]|uniref:hypothetical protein n=1 Tax=Carboxylicivirga marina TaxID=2800988 RepID=UPI0025987E6B|nr:hypothetical protein [uncultured Carboxylicivirga sp.]
MDTTSLVVLGIYTAAYVVVFMIQRNHMQNQKEAFATQMQNLKETNASIKNFMEIFDLDEIKKYVAIKEESAQLKAQNMLENDEKLKKMIEDGANENLKTAVNIVKQLYTKQMGDEHKELVAIAIEVIRRVRKDQREAYIKTTLPRNSRYLLKMIEDPDFDD